MISANLSAFSVGKAVGRGGGTLPYVLEMLQIAGGGTGANTYWASGGGAPGEFKTTTVSEPAAGLSYSMSVGAGAASVNDSSQNGPYGATSEIYRGPAPALYIFTKGGGGGGHSYAAPPANYNSAGGGGGGSDFGTGALHLNGYTGGNGGQNYPHYTGGGGAGHGGNGANGGTAANSGGAGGAGLAWLDGVARGGGGGGMYTSRETTSLTTQAAGGSGGGGTGGHCNSSTSTNGSNATANTGSGGGGGGRSSPNYALGGNGASGVIIVRYPGPTRGSGGTITSSGGYTYHTFNSSGTFTTA